MHLLALPLSLLGLAVGVLLITFDPVTIARRSPTASIGRTQEPQVTIAIPLPVALTADEVRVLRTLGPLPPAPEDPTNRVSTMPRAAWLGQILFYDPRLSGSGKFSCASCHDPARWFADGLHVAEAAGVGTRNTPTLLNTVHGRWFTWDGRSDSMWSQGLQPIENTNEMNGNRVAIVRLLADDPQLRREYEMVFGPIPTIDATRRSGLSLPTAARPVPDDPQDELNVAWLAITEASRNTVNRIFSNVGKAIAAYESKLDDGGAAIDRFIAGLNDDGTASTDPLSPAELRGFKLFVGKAGCINCHSGPTLSDHEFHDIGVPPPDGGLPRDAGRYLGVTILKADMFNAAGSYSDGPESERGLITDVLVNSPENWGRFKTPSLRGVSKTAPYMHAGQFETLDQVVTFYSTLAGAVQLDHHAETVLSPLNLSEDEISEIVSFLGALHGPGPAEELVGPPRRPFGM